MTDLAPIVNAVKQAAQLCRTIQADGVQSHAKGDESPVTTADYGGQALIGRALAAHFPNDTVIAEEGGAAYKQLVSADGRGAMPSKLEAVLGEPVSTADVLAWLDYGQSRPRDGRRTWVIDPIDGTVGFIGGRYYAICVSYMIDNVPIGAVMGLPRSPLHEGGTILYTDEDGLWALPMDSGEAERVGASGRTEVASLRIMESFKLPPHEQALASDVRKAAGLEAATVEFYDSQLKYGMVAAGYGDAFVRMPRDIAQEPHYIWDHATGAALLRAGGGRLTALDGTPLDFTRGDTLPHTGFIASNGDEALHEKLLHGVKALFGAEWGL